MSNPVQSSAEDDSDSDSAEGSDSESDDEAKAKDKKPKPATETEESPFKKRKALDDPQPSEWSKKSKTTDGDSSATLFVGNLAWGVNDDKLYEAFGQFEGILGARVVTDAAGGRSRGFGYVDFGSSDAAAKAMDAMQKQDLEGRALNIDFSSARSKDSGSGNFKSRANDRASTHNDQMSPESDTLFVGNLPFDVDEDTVRTFFEEVAEVKSCRLPTDP